MAQKRNKRRNNTRKKNNDGILGPLIGLLFGSSTVALLLLVVLFAQTLGKASNQNGVQQGNGSGKHHSVDEEYINIDADSFRGYVGQRQRTCLQRSRNGHAGGYLPDTCS